MGRHVAPRRRRGGRLAAAAAAAGVAISIFVGPLGAQAVVLSHGGGNGPDLPGVLGGVGGAAGAPGVAGAGAAGVAGVGTAALDGRAIAALAWAQLGHGLAGPNTVNGGDYNDSTALPDAWCAAFSGWAWAAGGVSTAGLDGWAGSFLDYGVRHGTFHTASPRVGDAALFAMSAGVAQASASGTLADSHLISHVGIVVAVTPTTVTIVNGDWGDGNGGPHLVRMSSYPIQAAGAPTYEPSMRQYLSGYVDPVAG
ncbi:hypothetical protein ACFOYW_08015 [Gryllotalpicola reticulitermitis]|uniref:CHAP domain-containing protein n=1 Tax=Gryllotalpicola reticulitermitis TaxID=1184153 RepID=A0ABV8Q4S6_9MICO